MPSTAERDRLVKSCFEELLIVLPCGSKSVRMRPASGRWSRTLSPALQPSSKRESSELTTVPKARVVVVGAAGRMGARLVRLLETHDSLQLAGVVDRNDDPEAVIANAEVVIDFAAPAACAIIAPLCVKANAAYVMASTALTTDDASALENAAMHIPLLQAANFSIGVNVLAELVTAAAERLAGFDIEISEIHHKMKRDAPSGTALMLGAAARQGREALRDIVNRTGQRTSEELGYSAQRGGDVSGEHTVFFFGTGERIEHHASRHQPRHLCERRLEGGGVGSRKAGWPLQHARRSAGMSAATHTAYVALGGNLGDVLATFASALRGMSDAGLSVTKVSSAYRTSALMAEPQRSARARLLERCRRSDDTAGAAAAARPPARPRSQGWPGTPHTLGCPFARPRPAGFRYSGAARR